MSDRIIRLTTPEGLNFGTDPNERKYDSINVIRANYSEDLMAYFIKAKAGVLLFVNENLPVQDQAKVISFIKNEVKKCGIVEAGVLKRGFEYFSAGPCCEDNCSSVG